MKTTKKQISAIQRVINNCLRSYPKQENRAGECKVNDGVIVTDGCVLLHYPEAFGLKKADIDNGNYFNSLFQKGYDSGDFYAIKKPFEYYDRKVIKSNSYKNAAGILLIKLYSEDKNGTELKILFNANYVINAFEAVGKNAVGYIGHSGVFGFSYMIVEPEDFFCNLNDGIHAIVLPCLNFH